jgi:glycosyltransferase involved in cell wall biosynthesis
MDILIVKKIKDNIHGTVTLAGRLLQYYNAQGHRCYLTQYHPSSIIEGFNMPDQIVPVNEWNIHRHASHYRRLHIDVIFCLTTLDAIIGYQLQRHYFPQAKLFIGIYHPNQFFYPTYLLPNYLDWLNGKIARRIPATNLLFMDEPCRHSHEAYYKLSYTQSPIVPLPMVVVGKRLSEGHQPYKLVSVGRLNDFKPYPLGVMAAMARLKATHGIQLQYHIIGDGPLMGKMKKAAETAGLTEAVHFYGQVPYDKVNGLIQDGFCFIGMGTTVGEAAGIGLPALVAIVDSEAQTYGLLGELPNNVLGEKGEDIPLQGYEAALLRLCQMDTAEYRRQQALSLEKAAFYSVENVGQRLLDAFAKGQPTQLRIGWLGNVLYQLSRLQVRFFIKKAYRHK